MIIPTIKLPPLLKLNRLYDSIYFTITIHSLKEILIFILFFYRFQALFAQEKS